MGSRGLENALFHDYELGVYSMTTTGELRVIIEELMLVDIGDAADYLGEGMTAGGADVEEEYSLIGPFTPLQEGTIEFQSLT
jgi:hypothetical protein